MVGKTASIIDGGHIQLGLSHTNEQCYVSIITMLFSYVRGQQRIDNNEKCRQIAGNFDCHADAVVRRGAYCLMEIIQGFTRSHWMPQSVPAGYCPGGRHGQQI